MKTLKTLILVAIAGSFLLVTSCKKDDDNKSTNILKYDNTEYTLKSGYLENYGQDSIGAAFNVDLTMYTAEVTVHESGGAVDSISGTGQVIYFEIFTSTADGIASGDYVYDAMETGANGTFDYGIFSSDISTFEAVDIEDGVVHVVKDGNTYDITIVATDVLGKNISGAYKGALTYYNYAGMKSSKLKR